MESTTLTLKAQFALECFTRKLITCDLMACLNHNFISLVEASLSRILSVN